MNSNSNMNNLINDIDNMTLSHINNENNPINAVNVVDGLVNNLDGLGLDELNYEPNDDINYDNENYNSNPLYQKFIPFEVYNYYCKEYFDDEDFIHMTFELPNELLDEIMHSYNSSITEYFEHYLSDINPNDLDETGLLHYNMYKNLVIVFNKILDYQLPNWYYSDTPRDINDFSKFDTDWTTHCRELIHQLKHILNLGINDDVLQYLCNYNKEVFTGCFIIVSRLDMLFSHWNDKTALNDFISDVKDYRHAIIRLVNNICVIMSYLKFYYLRYPLHNDDNNDADNSGCGSGSVLQEITPNEDEMITMET